MAEIKACIFDLDGVIVDTAKYHYRAWKRLCNKLGFDLTEEENESLKGISREGSLNILLKKGGLSLSDNKKADLTALKNGWYLEFIEKMKADEALPGAIEFIKATKESGRKIALGSSSRNALKILETLEIVDLFDAVIDGTKVSRGKPDPQTFQLGAEALKMHPCECVVFEDAQAGVEAALAGGMYIIGVGNKTTLNRANHTIEGFQNVGMEIFEKL
ncbi:MAG: beta-phosphoglucomutase [Flavobacteriales bacterium]|nr:beta-phosphoglucomutase [Flavobacteriales bacterium]